jgi:hypothetical protein
MQDHQAKMKTLREIIGVMDEHALAPIKAKQAEKARAMAPAAPAPEASAPAAGEDELDAESLKALQDMYDRDEKADQAAPVTGGY